MSNFNNYAKYYDLLYKDKDYKAESDYVYACLKKINPAIKSILELGSGSGNHAKHLTKSKLSITGIERSVIMVKESLNKKIQNFNPVVGDITHFELHQTFDAAISLFHVISYLTDNESLLSCFKSVHHHLNPNGLFLFDIWFTPAVYSQKPDTRIKRFGNETISVLRIAESMIDIIENVVNVNFEVLIEEKETGKIEVVKEVHPMRHFSIPELGLLASLTGFKVIHTEEYLTKHVPSDTTWGVCVILQKK
jgi:SAM-dependent methyltransferase